MKNLSLWKLLALSVAVILIVAACGGTAQPDTTEAESEAPAEEAPAEETAAEEDSSAEGAAEESTSEEPLKFVYVSPDPLGVNQFLIMGQTGLELAGEQHGAETAVFESESDPTSRAENVRAAVNEGADIVIVLGFEFNDIIPTVAEENPDVEFLIVDQCVENPGANVHCAVFREYEASFLVGAVAASLTEADHIGVVGALDIPFLHRYTDGYTMGAQQVNPDIQVDVRWVGGENPFADPARAKEQALAILAEGADHIFTATAGGDFGVFEAAAEEGFFAYGVDVNQCPEAPGQIVENLIKRVDTAIVESVDQILAGEEEAFLSYGLAEGGIGLVSLTTDNPEESQCVIMDHPEVIETVRGIQQQIIDGEITIEDPMFAQ